MNRIMFVGVLILVGIAVTAIGAVEAGDRHRTSRDEGKTTLEPRHLDTMTPTGEDARRLPITAALMEDGRWAIAGVTAFSRDAQGRAIIEVKKDGDFDTDAVLSVFAPLIEMEDGRVVTGGILGIKDNGVTVTLTLREQQIGWGTVAGDPPASMNGCEGANDNGNFFCVRNVSICTTACYEREVVGVTMCDCVEAE